MRAIPALVLICVGLGIPGAVGTARGAPFDSIYDSATLAERQQAYPKFVLGVFHERILPALTEDEKKTLSGIRFTFPLNAPKYEPFGYLSGNGRISLSIASFKLLNDLMFAYAWLGRHGYTTDTINDYLAMVQQWRQPGPPPAPLAVLGVPETAHNEPDTADMALHHVRSAMLFVILHELGHLYNGDRPTDRPEVSQMQEIRADAFALDLLARLGITPDGAGQYLDFAAAVLILDPTDYPTNETYLAAVREQTHPVSTERVRQIAINLDTAAAKYSANADPEAQAAFRRLSAEMRKLASVKTDPDMVRIRAERGKELEPRDLAPRRSGEILSTPIDAHPGDPPFAGKLRGIVKIGKSTYDAEMFLENRSGKINGSFGTATKIGHLQGEAVGDSMSYSWRMGQQHGRGQLRFTGAELEGAAYLEEGGSPAVWRLSPIQPIGR